MSRKKKLIATTVVLVIAGLIVALWCIRSWKFENLDKFPMIETENCSIDIEESETIGTEVDIVSGTETDINVIDPEGVIKAMVYLENGAAGGNGSIYEMTKEEVIIVTTYHLLQNAEKVSVRFYDNMYAEASVIGINEKHDVGFVSIPVDEVPVDTLNRIKAIQRNDSMYDSLIQGSPMAYHFLFYDGTFVCQEVRKGSIGAMNWYVEDFEDELIYSYCEVQPGMSGCAAIAEDGSYIGMFIGGYENESAAISIRVIDKVYQELEIFTKS